MNDVVAKKTREIIKMHLVLEGPEFQPVEELDIIIDDNGKKSRSPSDMEKYAPLIFEECYVRNRGPSRLANTAELD